MDGGHPDRHLLGHPPVLAGATSALTTLGFLGLSVPDFMLGLVYLFVASSCSTPRSAAWCQPDLEQAPWTLRQSLVDLVNHLLWPAVILVGVAGTAQLIRIMRGNLLETLGQQYVTTARAKGLHRTDRRQPVRRARGDQPADQRHGHAAART